MIALDTNVIVRYLTQDDPDQARGATTIIDSLTSASPGFIATIVWAEIHWVLTRAYGFGALEVIEKLADLSLSDEIRAEDQGAVASALASARHGADFADALIGAAAKRAGCDEVVTFDRRASAKLGWRLVSG